MFLGHDGWRWLVEPDAFRVEPDRLTWTCQGETDLWRITEGVRNTTLRLSLSR
jgi:regulation of enolase protein 1 (concanavalin A-like superfamily)